MTQHRDLATAIRRAVFDRIESDRTLVSCNVEQAIEDALILHAGKGGQPDPIGPHVRSCAKSVVSLFQNTYRIGAPTEALRRIDELARALELEGR